LQETMSIAVRHSATKLEVRRPTQLELFRIRHGSCERDLAPHDPTIFHVPRFIRSGICLKSQYQDNRRTAGHPQSSRKRLSHIPSGHAFLMLHACRRIGVIQPSRKFEEEGGLLREDDPTKLLRPLPLLTHGFERKTLGLGHPSIILPSFTLRNNRDFK